MRCGFYQRHTAYRVDPLAIAFIFGVRSLAEIEAAFPGRLYETLTTHFAESISSYSIGLLGSVAGQSSLGAKNP